MRRSASSGSRFWRTVRAGRSGSEEIEGNSHRAIVTATGVRVQNMFVESGEDYTVDETHTVIIDYWKWLTPDEEERARQIAAYTAEFGREHPCRDHLG